MTGQRGGQLPVYYGRSMQRGYGLGGIFRGLLRSAVPLLKRGAQNVGRQALRSGMDLAHDVLNGQGVKRAAKRRAGEFGQRLMSGQKRARVRAPPAPVGQNNRRGAGRGKKPLKRGTRPRAVSRKRVGAQRGRTSPDIFN